MMLFELFWVYFQIGLFSFGGGYAAMPLIQSLVVEEKAWLTMAEFGDLSTIAEMTPGPIAVNSATFVGQKVAGLSGALVCTLACILPSLIIVLTLAYLYARYRNLKIVKSVLTWLRPAVVAMIATAGLTLTLVAFFGTFKRNEFPMDRIHLPEVLIFFICLALLRFKKIDPIQAIFLSAVVGTGVYLIL